MTGSEQREAARQFINRWRGKGKEDEDGRSYWIELLSNVFGVENVTERIDFEKKVVENANPSEIKKCPSVMERIENVREFRLKSKKAATRKKAEVPFLFDENHACKTDYIAIPVVSSQNRRYIPMELLHKDVIAGNKLFMMPEGSLYYFGILTSNVHMAWMRTVTGRLKSDYSYSNTIVYNNFPWPLSTNQQRLKIEQTAQSILDARSLYPDNSLADLYNPVLMPLELRKAHIANDKAVMAAYGFSLKMSEEDCVAELMKLYQKKLQEEKEAAEAALKQAQAEIERLKAQQNQEEPKPEETLKVGDSVTSGNVKYRVTDAQKKLAEAYGVDSRKARTLKQP